MIYLEPDDPIEVKCPDCGEEESIYHVGDSVWMCNECKDTFSDGSENTYYEDDI